MTRGVGARKTRSFLSQPCLEKLHHIGVELFMERRTVEGRQAVADFWLLPGQTRVTGRQEVVMAGAGDDVILGRPRQTEERAETPCVQMIVWEPFVEHVRDEPPKLGWASPELQDLALVIVGVPWWLTAATTKPAWAKARVVS